MDLKTCYVCGNRYDKAFQIVMDDQTYVFDSFECAVDALAPICSYCGVQVIGHGVEADEVVYCSVHCAHQEGVEELKDRV